MDVLDSCCTMKLRVYFNGKKSALNLDAKPDLSNAEILKFVQSCLSPDDWSARSIIYVTDRDGGTRTLIAISD